MGAKTPHLRRRPQRPTASPSTWSTRTAPSLERAKRSRVHGRQRRPDDRHQRRANVNEGSAYSLTLGAVTDPGTDTVVELHRPLGQRQHRHLRHQRRQDAHLRRRPRRPTRSPSTWSTRMAPSSTAPTRSRCTSTTSLRRSRSSAARPASTRASASTVPLHDHRSGQRRGRLDRDELRRQRRQLARHEHELERLLQVHLPRRPDDSTPSRVRGERLRRRHRQHRSRQRVSVSERRPDDHAVSGRGLASTRARRLQLDLGTVTDPGTDTVTELHRTTGATATRDTLPPIARRQDAHLRRRRRRRTRSRWTWSTDSDGAFPNGPSPLGRVTVQNVAPDRSPSAGSSGQRGLALQLDPGRAVDRLRAPTRSEFGSSLGRRRRFSDTYTTERASEASTHLRRRPTDNPIT